MNSLNFIANWRFVWSWWSTPWQQTQRCITLLRVKFLYSFMWGSCRWQGLIILSFILWRILRILRTWALASFRNISLRRLFFRLAFKWSSWSAFGRQRFNFFYLHWNNFYYIFLSYCSLKVFGKWLSWRKFPFLFRHLKLHII